MKTTQILAAGYIRVDAPTICRDHRGCGRGGNYHTSLHFFPVFYCLISLGFPIRLDISSQFYVIHQALIYISIHCF